MASLSAVKKPVICFGCGSDISEKANNRYNLLSSSFNNLLDTWKRLLAEEGIDPEELLYERTINSSIITGRICRPCAASIEKVIKLEEVKSTLKADMMDAIGKINSICFPHDVNVTEDQEFHASSYPSTPSKRQSQSNDQQHQSKKRRKNFSTVSPKVLLQVQSSDRVKSYTLPKHLNKAGNSLARGSLHAFAKECLSDDSIRPLILKALGREIRSEIKRLASRSSILHSSSIQDIQNFQWNIQYQELRDKSPTLLTFLQAATDTRTPRTNRTTIICICAAVILKYRYSHLSLIQKIIGLLLYSSQCSKVVYQRLSSVGLCVSYTTVNKLVNELSKDHDIEVTKWRDDIISKLPDENHNTAQEGCFMLSNPADDANDSESTD